MNDDQKMIAVDQQLSHIWVVRTFIKHCEEAEEDEELREVARDLYDFALALGASFNEKDSAKYLKMANKKFRKLHQTTALFLEIQPEISSHTNFKMAAQSLSLAVNEIAKILGKDEVLVSSAEVNESSAD